MPPRTSTHLLRPRLALGLALAAAGWALTAPTPSRAAEFHVQAETVGDAYQLVRSDDEVLNRRRLHQYVGFGAYDLMGDGDYQLNVVTLFRFDADFGIEDDELDDVRSLRREQLTIQTAYIEGRNLGGVLDFRAGRLMHIDPIDFLFLDGVVATLRSPWYLGVELTAGIEADNDLGSLTSSQFELDGTRIIESGVAEQDMDQAKIVLGAALVTTGLKWTRARIGYRRIFSDGKINQEKVGAAIFQRIGGRLHLHASASWDLFKATADQIRAGLRWQATDAFEIEGEFGRLVPSFDADSIFNIFSTRPLNDVTSRVRWYARTDRWLYAGGSVQLFQNEDYADGIRTGTIQGGDVGWGAMAGYHHGFGPDGRISVDVHHDDGYGGSRTLLDVSGKWTIVPGTFELDGRMTGLIFADGLQNELKAAGGGYQLGARYLIDTRAAFQIMAEHNFNRIHTSQFRLMAVMDINLWL